MRKALFQIICLWLIQASSYDLVISDIDSVYPDSDNECLHVYELSKSEKSIEVIEPEPEEHVQEAMTLFKWEW